MTAGESDAQVRRAISAARESNGSGGGCMRGAPATAGCHAARTTPENQAERELGRRALGIPVGGQLQKCRPPGGRGPVGGDEVRPGRGFLRKLEKHPCEELPWRVEPIELPGPRLRAGVDRLAARVREANCYS